ncbi:hypothetical protein ERJ75_000684800 [Trypanosoma vivax]|nr:hypothetical protein ERJ75_000684800 [Trypanosoma vivax]
MLRYVLSRWRARACWRGRARARRRRRASVRHRVGPCNTATVLAGISAAAESAAADMKRRRGFLSSWRRVASEVSEETQNLTVAGEAEKLGASRRAWATLSTRHSQSRGRGTHKRAPDRLRQALRDILRQRQRRRENMHR